MGDYRAVIREPLGWLLQLAVFVVAALALVGFWFGSTRCTDAANPATGSQPDLRASLDAEYQQELLALAATAPDVASIRGELQERIALCRRNPLRIYLFVPPAAVDGPPEGLADEGRRWWEEYMGVRRRQAARLEDLARRVVDTDAAWSYQLLHEALWENPELESVRTVLGYRRSADGWVYGGQAVAVSRGGTAVREFALAARQYVQAVTPHFRILAETDESRVRRLAAQLEQFHCVWRQLFFDYWSPPGLLAQRLERGAPPAPARRDKHLVVYLRDRQRYLDLLRNEAPQIEKTLGIYLDQRRAVVLYGEAQNAEATQLHEVTHQLFAETVPTASDIGATANVWAIEGVALFMESLRWNGHRVVLGGVDAPRLQYARYRAFQEKFYVPVEQFVRLNRSAVQRDPNIAALYSQAAALAQLLLTAENGTWRKPFVEYLKLVYQGRDQPDSLWQSTGLAPSDIDRRFGQFLDVTDAQLADCLPVRELVLGRTQITDHGLAYLPLESLEWLDLAYTSVTDHGIERLESAKNLRRLSLEGTRITSRGLETVSRLEQLQELDLSELPLDDHSLSALMRLKRLKSLWLTNTPISDEGLGQLALLPDLEFLDLRGTQTSSQGRQRLAGQRPRLHIVAE